MSALGASENPLSRVEYSLPVLELLLTTTATTLPYRSLLLLDRTRLDRLRCDRAQRVTRKVTRLVRLSKRY